MSDMTKPEAVAFFAEAFLGKHHIPGGGHGEANVKSWGGGWHVLTSGDVSTYDADVLTRLCFLAHDYGFRVEISSAMRYLRIAIHKRTLRTGGACWDRHPTLETAIETHRRYYKSRDIEGGSS